MSHKIGHCWCRLGRTIRDGRRGSRGLASAGVLCR